MFISFVWGVFGKGVFCPGGFCPGVYVRGVFVLIPLTVALQVQPGKIFRKDVLCRSLKTISL